MPAFDEASLARAAAAGDGQAFATLYDEYEGRIFNFCLRVVGSREDAADATQDAFLKVLQRLPKIPADRELNFGAYLFTAARNASYDVIGKRKRADPVEAIPESGARPLSGDERGAIELDPERIAMLGAVQESVQLANSKLPERHREVLALREVEELSYDEIAEIMDMNRNSVAQLISRARIKLRDELQGTALASIAVSSPDCERALPLIAMRQDGQLKDDADRAWLQAHVATCDTCKVSIEAMEEAGQSYRAWAPVLPVAWLWKATAAHAMDLSGSDWNHLLDRQRELHAGGASTGAGAASGATVGAGAGAGAGAGGGRAARRISARALAGTAFVSLFLLMTVGAVVLSDDDTPAAPAAEPANTSALGTGTEATTTAPRRTRKVVVAHVRKTASGRTITTHETVVVPVTPAPPANNPKGTVTHRRPSSSPTRPQRTTTSTATSSQPVTPPASSTPPVTQPATPPVDTTPTETYSVPSVTEVPTTTTPPTKGDPPPRTDTNTNPQRPPS